MSIKGFDLTDFSIGVSWPNLLSLPPDEFQTSMENAGFEMENRGSTPPRYEYSNDSSDIMYNISDASLEMSPSDIDQFGDVVEEFSEFLDSWDMTDNPDEYYLQGDAIIRYDFPEGRDAGDVIAEAIDAPDMVESLSGPEATPVSWRYSNSHRKGSEPEVDVKLEPYVENPEYFYILLRRRSSQKEEVWETARDVEGVIEDLIALVV